MNSKIHKLKIPHSNATTRGTNVEVIKNM